MSSIPYIAVYVYFCQMAQSKPIEILVPQFTSMDFHSPKPLTKPVTTQPFREIHNFKKVLCRICRHLG